MAKARLKLEVRQLTKIITLGVIVATFIAIIIAGIFIINTLDKISATPNDVNQGAPSIKTIDSEKLKVIQGKLEDKTRLDAPRQGALQNPFNVVPGAPPEQK